MRTLLYLLPTFLHCIGLFLLYKVKQSSDDKIRYWYLVSLSSVEASLSLFYAVLVFIPVSVRNYFYIFLTMFLILMYMLMMLLILLDRVLEIYLHLRYPLYCTVPRTKAVIFGCIVFSVLCAIPATIVLEKDQPIVFEFFSVYIWPSAALVFLVCSIVGYGYVYVHMRAFRRAREWDRRAVQQNIRQQDAENGRQSAQQMDTFYKRLRKNFFLPSLLIISFIICWVFPVVFYFSMKIQNAKFDDEKVAPFMVLAVILIVSGICFDACAYIFCFQPIRSYLRRLKGRIHDVM